MFDDERLNNLPSLYPRLCAVPTQSPLAEWKRKGFVRNIAAALLAAFLYSLIYIGCRLFSMHI